MITTYAYMSWDTAQEELAVVIMRYGGAYQLSSSMLGGLSTYAAQKVQGRARIEPLVRQ